MKEPILEVIGTAKGSVLQMMPEINFGAIWDKKNKREVYFSIVTEFSNTSYSELNEGDIVEMLVVRTQRGFFAKNLSLKEARPPQEVEISPSL
ncbi:MAG: cold shock domain-containing protein [Bdellovibrionales bacterium]|nr:cold shock domain-containing protein [Bdellovibrionales bacterium]